MLPILRRRWRKPVVVSWPPASRCCFSSSSSSHQDAKPRVSSSSSSTTRPKISLSHHQVRQSFIDYFVHSHGHQFIRSSPVKPSATDTSLLFVNAGMNQFKPIFLDQLGVDPQFDRFKDLKRVVNSQKCIRVGGKHCDLENVGADFTHHTFFEMLGNWSFNDYFKKEACQMAWSLLTQVYGLDPSRLVVTIFGGHPQLGLPPDLETFEVWRQLGVPAHRIVPLGMADNFWEMGETGPCGICTEIHYQRHPIDVDPGSPAYQEALEASCFEIWNIVFMQYYRDSDRKLHRLAKNYVDTGMGLERILSLVQGVKNNYETDLFSTYFQTIEKICKWPTYSGHLTDPKDVSYRILADHSRMAAISIADGVVPDDRGAGYLLRRVLRRALDALRTVSNLHRSLPGGTDEATVLGALAEATIESLGSAFPELREHSGRILAVIQDEVQLYTSALMRNGHLMKLSEGLQVGLGSDAAVNRKLIEEKISEVARRVVRLKESIEEETRPKVNQVEVDLLRREYSQLVELSTADESISGRFGLTSDEIEQRLTQLDLDLVSLESTVDRVLEQAIAQFEVEAKRRLTTTATGSAAILSLPNDCISGRSLDFFLLKAGADLFGTDRPLAIFLKQIGEEQQSFILQLTVPIEFQEQMEAKRWFEVAVEAMEDDLKNSMVTFPMKNKKVKRIVRFRVKLAEDAASGGDLERIEEEMRRRVTQVAAEAFKEL